jgi:hypothetical protein
MRDKKKTKNIKVRDLKPKKDARGGAVATSASTSSKFAVQAQNRNVSQTHIQG